MDKSKPKKNILKKGFQYLSQPLLWRMYRWYLSKPRWYAFEDLKIRLLPSVFHPGWLLSTKVLLEYVRGFEVRNKTVLELGAGSGMISLCLAKAGAIVTASDINPNAIQAVKESCAENKLNIKGIESNLFENIPIQHFDFILVNPPYYPKEASNNQEKAFFCGANFEYFKDFFRTLKPFLSNENQVLMILSEDCDLDQITRLAEAEKLKMRLVHQLTKMQEGQFIFSIQKS